MNLEILDLAKLIDNNLFVTLYGRTGIGKTSLLNAGVCPILRQYNYIPICIRLSQESTDNKFASSIIKKIKALDGVSFKIKEDTPSEVCSAESPTFLWQYFSTTSFEDFDGNEIYPVIILDQFEEIFFSSREEANLLLLQINALLSNYLVKEHTTDTNYRFVASIREDNLFCLEDSIDELGIPLLKNNRYRLRPLQETEACKAILEPGMPFLDKTDAKQIAKRIVELSKDNDGTVSSLILSLISCLMYEKASQIDKANPKIKLSILPSTTEDADGILAKFYIENTTKKQRSIIGKELLTTEGHRKAANIDIPNKDHLLKDGCRLLQEIETDTGRKCEIVHDRMAKVIYMNLRQRNNNKFHNLLRAVIFLSLMGIALFSINISWYTIKDSNPYALKIDDTPKNNKTSLYYNKETITINIDSEKNPYVKRVYIGKAVKYIKDIKTDKDNLEFIIDPGNEVFSWGYIHCRGKVIGFMYKEITYTTGGRREYVNDVLYMQLYNAIVLENTTLKARLPKGIDVLNYKELCIENEEDIPSYGEKNITITDLNSYRYLNDKEITNVVLSGIEEIPDSAFNGCSKLETISLKGVKKIGASAFEGCTNLKYIDLSTNDSLCISEKAFKGCVKLDSVILPNKLHIIGDYIFDDCYNLRKITLPEDMDYESLDNIITMFSLCYNLDNICITSDSLFSWKEDSILYFKSLPIITNKNRKWKTQCGLIEFKGLILSTLRDKPINITKSFKSESWDKYCGNYYNSIIISLFFNTPHNTFIVEGAADSALYIPKVSSFTDDDSTYINYYYCIGSFEDLKEIHTPIADPYKFFISFAVDNNKSNIVLFVPYGCKEAYDESGLFTEYYDIKEDSWTRRVSETLKTNFDEYMNVIKWPGLFAFALMSIALYILLSSFNVKGPETNGISKNAAIIEGLQGAFLYIVCSIAISSLLYTYFNNYHNQTERWIIQLTYYTILVAAFAFISLLFKKSKQVFSTIFNDSSTDIGFSIILKAVFDVFILLLSLVTVPLVGLFYLLGLILRIIKTIKRNKLKL